MPLPRSFAAAQTIPVRGEIEANVERHLEMIAVAALEGATTVVFPELSLTGYELDLADDLAFAEDDVRIGPLASAAVSTGATLVVGAPIRIASRLHIGAFIVSPDGPVQVYTKHHLGAFPADVNPGGTVPPAEATVFQPGDKNPLVDLGAGAGAVAICADIGRSSHAERAAKGGAQAYLASTFVIPADLEGDTAKLQGYAERHSMAVVFANFGGPSGGLSSGGSSAIWSDSGALLVQLRRQGAGIPIAAETPAGWTGKAVMLG
jgi:predicted amidohydrolase